MGITFTEFAGFTDSRDRAKGAVQVSRLTDEVPLRLGRWMLRSAPFLIQQNAGIIDLRGQLATRPR